MKIMMLVNDTTFAYNLRREVLQRLVFSGYDVVVACKYLSHVEELKALGIRLININIGRRSKNPLSDMKLFLNIVKLLHTEKPDIVLTNNIKSNIYGGMACRLLGIRYMPNITGLGTAVEYPGPMQRLTTFLYKHGIAGADCVFFQNEENEQFFRDRRMLSIHSRTCLLPGSGVNISEHSLTDYPSEGQVTRFLFVGRIMQDKGITELLDAFEIVKTHHADVHLDIVG